MDLGQLEEIFDVSSLQGLTLSQMPCCKGYTLNLLHWCNDLWVYRDGDLCTRHWHGSIVAALESKALDVVGESKLPQDHANRLASGYMTAVKRQRVVEFDEQDCVVWTLSAAMVEEQNARYTDWVIQKVTERKRYKKDALLTPSNKKGYSNSLEHRDIKKTSCRWFEGTL